MLVLYSIILFAFSIHKLYSDIDSNQKVLLRFDIGEISLDILQKTLNVLENTQYKMQISQEFAPKITNCVTFTRFLIQEITHGKSILPRHYIGEMAKHLLKSSWQGALLIPVREAIIGDLCFFYGYSLYHKASMIRHIGIVTDNDFGYHHSTRGKNGNGGMKQGNLILRNKDEKEQYHPQLSTKNQIFSTDPRMSQ